MDENQITGGCYCGKVRYTISGDILSAGICHCHSCQHMTGGSSRPLIGVLEKDLSIVGDFKEFSRPGSSGGIVHYGFCDSCGSTMFGRMDTWPGFRTISAISLDDESFFQPEAHFWTAFMPKWMHLDDDLKKFPGSYLFNNSTE